MRLKKVTLTNFRCFEDLEINLHPRLTVLVADNGGGKTAILDGIAIGLTPLLAALSSVNQRLKGPGFKDTDFRLRALPPPAAPLQPTQLTLFQPPNQAGEGSVAPPSNESVRESVVRVAMEAATSPGESALSWDFWRGSQRGVEPENKTGQSALQKHASSLLEDATGPFSKIWPVVAYYGARRGWIVIPERLRRTEENYDHPSSALVGALDALSDFGEMLKWFDAEESTELRARKEGVVSSSQFVPLEAVRQAIVPLLGGAYSNPRFNSRHKFVLKEHSDGGELQVSQLSQGYQSMLALGMDFARRLALANRHRVRGPWFPEGPVATGEPLASPTHAPAIMLVDEIDLHLHPSWQQRVLPDLMRAFPGTQFIVTTHSPQVLSTVDKECIRVVRMVEGRHVLETPRFQTKGVESASVLSEVMGVDPVPRVEEAKWLDEYRGMIESGTHDSPEGLELRSRLVAHFGESHPVMREHDTLIRFQTFKRRQAAAG